jgi:hypothetical protein
MHAVLFMKEMDDVDYICVDVLLEFGWQTFFFITIQYRSLALLLFQSFPKVLFICNLFIQFLSTLHNVGVANNIHYR